MYIILTSKPGQFHTEAGNTLAIVEAYEYRFCGKVRAIFQIASLDADIKIRIVEDQPPYVVNHVPSKFLDKFESIELARKELWHLTKFGGIDASLIQYPITHGAR